ncbi:MAG TPA: YdcF family protein [Verrucomicrobiae bacterium]|nr:YdcF family protein [Verrucomicrobiae bacterium]
MSERTAILAHGKNWQIPVPEDPAAAELSIESQINAEAAGLLYERGAGDVIIFSGGHTAGPEYPSEARAMLDSMRGHKRFSGSQVPEEAIRLEEDSSSTAGNLAEVHARLEEFGVDNVVLLTVGYHLPRTIMQARQEGLPVRGFARSDYVIRGLHADQNHLLARRVLSHTLGQHGIDWHPAYRMATAYGLEGLAWGSLAAGPLGRYLGETVTDKVRHQS